MIALELTIIGVSGAFVGLLAKFKNVIWRIGKPDSQETMLTTVRPVRLKAETRESRGSDSTSKGSASSDALANAAARVFRQMEMGQAPTAKGPPSASHAHEGAEQRGSDERRLFEEQHRPVLRRSEPAAPLPA